MVALRWRKSKVFYRERSKLGVEWQIPGVERRWAGSGGLNKKLPASGSEVRHSLAASSNKLRGALRVLNAPRGVVGLKAKPRRHREGAGAKSRSSLAEVGVGNVVRDASRVEVQIVEQVVGVNAELKFSVFTEHRHVRQTEGLGQRHVHVPVSRAGERVATYAGLWKRGSEVGAAIGSVSWRREICCATLGEIRPSPEGIVASAGARATQVGSREQLRIPALSAIEAPSVNIHQRSPGEPRVKSQNAAERPAASDLFHPIIAAVEEDGLPHAKKLEGLADIVVRASVIQAGVIRVDLFRVRRGTSVHALGPSELSIGHELAGEPMVQFSEHSIVVSAAIHAPVVAAADLRVQVEAARSGDGIRVRVEVGITRQAALISQRRHEVMTQIVLGIQRIVMGTHGRQVRGEDADIDGAGGGQSIRAKGQNRVGIHRITID